MKKKPDWAEKTSWRCAHACWDTKEDGQKTIERALRAAYRKGAQMLERARGSNSNKETTIEEYAKRHPQHSVACEHAHLAAYACPRCGVRL